MAKTTKQYEADLRSIFRSMDPHAAQEIREAYYKAIEGLRTLATALEIADASQEPSAGLLIEEHFFAVEAIESIDRSRLGSVL